MTKENKSGKRKEKTKNKKKMSIEKNLILKLEKKIEQLEVEVEKLSAENKALRKENIELKDKLGITSKNSSIPSSKELYKIKKKKSGSGLKAGGQIGHKGNSRIKEEPDEIIEIKLESKYCECGGEIGILKDKHIHRHIDIPEINPEVSEYHIEKGRCRKCNKRAKGKLPEGIDNDLFGNKIKAIIASLSGFYKNSKREICSILRDIFNIKISVGSISNNEGRVSLKAKEAYEEIEVELSYSSILHIDETSHYNKGKLGWCWLFSNDQASMIKLADSRGMKVLKDSVFGSDDHIIVTDRYSAYNYFATENRQICWAHLARDFERFANSANMEVKEIGYYLKQVAIEIFGLEKLMLEEKIDMIFFLRRARKLRKRTWYYLKNILCLENAEHAARVAKNIMKSEDMMWKFLEDPKNIPLTNNHAERQIRHYVVYRKNSYFTQSDRGNKFLERIISLFLTWKQKDYNPFQKLLFLLAQPSP